MSGQRPHDEVDLRTAAEASYLREFPLHSSAVGPRGVRKGEKGTGTIVTSITPVDCERAKQSRERQEIGARLQESSQKIIVITPNGRGNKSISMNKIVSFKASMDLTVLIKLTLSIWVM